MTLQQQLGDSQQLQGSQPFPSLPRTLDLGLLGNQLGQTPSFQGVADSLVDSYHRLRSASQPAFKLAFAKLQKFTPEGRTGRIAASLQALSAAQPTELSLAEWKEIVEELDDDEA